MANSYFIKERFLAIRKELGAHLVSGEYAKDIKPRDTVIMDFKADYSAEITKNEGGKIMSLSFNIAQHPDEVPDHFEEVFMIQGYLIIMALTEMLHRLHYVTTKNDAKAFDIKLNYNDTEGCSIEVTINPL